jgi:hypothetical protein
VTYPWDSTTSSDDQNLCPQRKPACTILGTVRPPIGHVYGYRIEPAVNGRSSLVTSYCDWSDIDPIWRQAGIFPAIAEGSLEATLGTLHAP